MKLPMVLLTGFGLGRMRPAPGSWGSLLPVVFALALVWMLGLDSRWMIDVSIALIGLIFAIACMRFGDEAERALGRKDPSAVVADEVAGQAIALLALPWRDFASGEGSRMNIAMVGVAFLAFRALDIWKPPPARGVQRMAGGWGILVDDLIAGAYALIVTQLIVRFAMA
jgi:phosphatidylglycerophosphatase A